MKVWKVHELNNFCKSILEDKLTDIILEGEISNFKVHSSGHIYFSLKDEFAQINAVMYKYRANYLKFKPKNGDKVIAQGTVSIYTKRGDYQIICYELKPIGIGELKKRFEELKEKLEKEGLFDTYRKRKLPILPQKIAVITSPTGAAIRDILNVLKERFENIELFIYPVRVQGEEAKYEIVKALENLNKYFKDMDVIILTRGGGSLEDLWAFNEEIVARAIFASRIPVISAVGHEIDWTISDFVADFRSPTPSAAALHVIESKKNLKRVVNDLNIRLKNSIHNILDFYLEKLNNLKNRKIFKNPETLIQNYIQEIDYLIEKLLINTKNFILNKEKEFNILKEKLKILSPLSTLKRGYSITFKLPEKKVLKSEKDVKIKDKLLIKLKDGEINCEVIS